MLAVDESILELLPNTEGVSPLLVQEEEEVREEVAQLVTTVAKQGVDVELDAEEDHIEEGSDGAAYPGVSDPRPPERETDIAGSAQWHTVSPRARLELAISTDKEVRTRDSGKQTYHRQRKKK